jgi:hypothetical protein
MSDIDELHQLMSGAHEGRDDALRDVLNALAGSPATHTPQPTPALTAFLEHPPPPHTTIAAQHQSPWTARLLQPRCRRRLRIVPAVLAGWLTPLLLGTATAVAATAATAVLIAYSPHSTAPGAPAPTSPPATSHPTWAATPARLLPTDPGRTRTTATSTPHATGVPSIRPTTNTGRSLAPASPSRTTVSSSPRPTYPDEPTTQPTPIHGDDGSNTDPGDDQTSHDDQDIEAPQTADPHDDEKRDSETRHPDRGDRETTTATVISDRSDDQGDD